MKMTSKLFLVSLMLTTASSFAAVCSNSKLTDFTVFTKEEITANSSDFQGSIGSAGTVKLNNFYVDLTSCESVYANGTLEISNAQTKGGVAANASVYVQNARVNGTVSTNENVSLKNTTVNAVTSPFNPISINSTYYKYNRKLPGAVLNFDSLVSQMNNWSSSLLTGSYSKNYSIEGDTLTLKAVDKITYFKFDAATFSNIKSVNLKGRLGQKIIINVIGEDFSLVDFDVNLAGDVVASDIVWNFNNATRIFIRHTANGAYGIPGTILAPKANVEFYEGLVTGALYVKAIRYDAYKGLPNSGQVNDGRYTESKLE